MRKKSAISSGRTVLTVCASSNLTWSQVAATCLEAQQNVLRLGRSYARWKNLRTVFVTCMWCFGVWVCFWNNETELAVPGDQELGRIIPGLGVILLQSEPSILPSWWRDAINQKSPERPAPEPRPPPSAAEKPSALPLWWRDPWAEKCCAHQSAATRYVHP